MAIPYPVEIIGGQNFGDGQGRRLIERAFQKHANDMEETMAVLKTNERAELVRLLKKVGLWAAARLDDKS